MAKKRPSLKDFLATGDVVIEGGGQDIATKETATPKKEGPKKPPSGEKKKAPPKKKPASSADKAPAKKTSKKKTPATVETQVERDRRLDELVKMLAPQDIVTWEKLLTAAEVAFEPMDLVKRREDFRTMARDRYTLFRMEERGKPLIHVRSSVQIREPLECLIKLDETGLITVYSPSKDG